MIWEWPGNDVGVTREWCGSELGMMMIWEWPWSGNVVGRWWESCSWRLRQYYSSSFGPIDIAYIQGLLGLSWVLVGGYQVVVWDHHGFGLGFLFGDPIWSDPLVKRSWMLCIEKSTQQIQHDKKTWKKITLSILPAASTSWGLQLVEITGIGRKVGAPSGPSNVIRNKEKKPTWVLFSEIRLDALEVEDFV